jgi:hypothetical protein
MLGANSRIKQELESKKQEFTYEEVLRITRNFRKVVGKEERLEQSTTAGLTMILR